MIDVTYVSHRHYGLWHAVSPTTRLVVAHESHMAPQETVDGWTIAAVIESTVPHRTYSFLCTINNLP